MMGHHWIVVSGWCVECAGGGPHDDFVEVHGRYATREEAVAARNALLADAAVSDAQTVVDFAASTFHSVLAVPGGNT
jgi:hypothetical protein